MRIRKERIRARLTQMQLAKMSGVTQAAISKLESGVVLDPSFETLTKITKALQRCGRRVQASDLQPRRQPALIKGFRSDAKRRRSA